MKKEALFVFIIPFLFVSVSALDLHPNETVTINNQTVHCLVQPCSTNETDMCLKYLPGNISSYFSIMTDRFNNISDRVSNLNTNTIYCLTLVTNHTQCQIDLITSINNAKNIQGTLDSVNSDMKEKNSIISNLQNLSTSCNSNIQLLTNQMYVEKNNQWFYAIGGCIFGVVAWYIIKRMGVSRSKGVSTHEGLIG